MGYIILRGDNPLWFVDESTGLMEYSEGGLANQIFELVDKKILGDKKDIRKCSIMSTLTNARPLTWPAVLASPVCEFCLAASVTMEADLPEMTGRFAPYISEAQ